MVTKAVKMTTNLSSPNDAPDGLQPLLLVLRQPDRDPAMAHGVAIKWGHSPSVQGQNIQLERSGSVLLTGN